jgi:hypothetical protein
MEDEKSLDIQTPWRTARVRLRVRSLPEEITRKFVKIIPQRRLIGGNVKK